MNVPIGINVCIALATRLKISLTICEGNAVPPYPTICFDQLDTGPRYEACQPMDMGTPSATQNPYFHNPPSGPLTYGWESSEQYWYHHQHVLFVQPSPLPGDAFFLCAQSAEFPSPGAAGDLYPIPTNGYEGGPTPSEWPDDPGFSRCATYPGGSAHLTTNISTPVYPVSYLDLSSEVCYHLVCKTR
jgi:hypothetical protein